MTCVTVVHKIFQAATQIEVAIRSLPTIFHSDRS